VVILDERLLNQMSHPEALPLDDDLLRHEVRNTVLDGLAHLPAEQRRLIECLFFEENTSYRQISRQLGIPAGSIGPTRARCLKKLQAVPSIATLAAA